MEETSCAAAPACCLHRLPTHVQLSPWVSRGDCRAEAVGAGRQWSREERAAEGGENPAHGQRVCWSHSRNSSFRCHHIQDSEGSCLKLPLIYPYCKTQQDQSVSKKVNKITFFKSCGIYLGKNIPSTQGKEDAKNEKYSKHYEERNQLIKCI